MCKTLCNEKLEYIYKCIMTIDTEKNKSIRDIICTIQDLEERIALIKTSELTYMFINKLRCIDLDFEHIHI
jgi:hypothetical protein